MELNLKKRNVSPRDFKIEIIEIENKLNTIKNIYYISCVEETAEHLENVKGMIDKLINKIKK